MLEELHLQLSSYQQSLNVLDAPFNAKKIGGNNKRKYADSQMVSYGAQDTQKRPREVTVEVEKC